MVEHGRELSVLAAALGTSLLSSVPMSWGDSGATWRLDLGDGRRVVARRSGGPGEARPDRIAEVMWLVAAAGIPVPAARSLTTDRATWLVSDHVAGDVGVGWLGDPERARALAASMGGLRRRLLDVDPSRIVSPPPGRPSARLRHPEERLAAALTEGQEVLADRRVAPAFVHGDFAPVNVILDDTGAVRALIDFEHAHVGDPLEDVAWWGWVVRHHHPAVWAAAWPAFCAAAGVDPTADERILRALTLRELERRAATARDPAVRDRWLGHLAEAAAW